MLVWKTAEVFFTSRDWSVNISFISDIESHSFSKIQLRNHSNVTCKYLRLWDWDYHVVFF